MKIFDQLLTTITTCLLIATPSQAFQVISAEDLNTGGGKHAEIDLTIDAEAEFLTNLTSDVTTETFETYSWNDSNLDLNFPNKVTASLGGDGQVYSIEHVEGVTDIDRINLELNTGRYAVSGINYWQTSAHIGGDSTFIINFSEDVAAFGFYAYDLGDFGGDLELNLYQDSELVKVISNTEHNFYEVVPAGETSGSALFIGIVGELQDDGSYETFDKVEFVIANEGGSKRDDFGFDDLTIAKVEQLVNHPEPSDIFPD